MDHYAVIAANFQSAIETIAMSVDALADAIGLGSQVMAQALLADRKIVACGNGVDAALAQLFACNLLHSVEQERPALPAMALGADAASVSAIARSGAIDDVYARQLRALGQPGDVLLCISSMTGAGNLSRAVRTAQERGMRTVLLSVANDGELAAAIRPTDVALWVEAARPARVVEIHTMVIHSLCELIDRRLFAGDDLA